MLPDPRAIEPLTLGLVEDSEEDFVAFSRILSKAAPSAQLVRWTRAEAVMASFQGGAPGGEVWPRVLIVDLNLPGIDGCELVRRLRGNERTSTLPMYVLSGSGRQQDVDRCYAAGANAYLTKPGNTFELQALIQTVLLSLTTFRAPMPAVPGPAPELAAHLQDYEGQLAAERAARQRAEALGRIAVRLAGLTTADEIASAFAGELMGGGVVQRAEVLRQDPKTARRAEAYSPDPFGDGTVGLVSICDGDDRVLANLSVGLAAVPDDGTQRFLAEACALAGQALGRAIRLLTEGAEATADDGDLPMHRWWNAALARALRTARKDGAPLTLVAISLDDLDRYSQLHGYVAGDRWLVAIVNAWRDAGHDLLTRSGDQLAALLAGHDAAQAAKVVDAIRRAPGLPRGFSVGAAEWDGEEPARQLIARAERALAEDRWRNLGD